MLSFRQFLREQDLLKEKNEFLKGIKTLRKFEKTRDSLSKEEQERLLNDIYDLIFPGIEIRAKEFQKLLIKLSKKFKNSEVKMRIKPFRSVYSKIIGRKKSLEDISDLIGGMVITQDKESANKAVKDIVRKQKSRIIDIDKKIKSGNKSGYFGATHIDFDMNGVTAELQVLPRPLMKKKGIAHKIYTNVRDKGASEYDNQTMRKLFVQGNLNSEAFDIDKFFGEFLENVLFSNDREELLEYIIDMSKLINPTS